MAAIVAGMSAGSCRVVSPCSPFEDVRIACSGSGIPSSRSLAERSISNGFVRPLTALRASEVCSGQLIGFGQGIAVDSKTAHWVSRSMRQTTPVSSSVVGPAGGE